MHAYPFPLGPGVLHEKPTRVWKAAHALNQLAGFQFKECYSQPSHRPPTAVQALVIKRLEAAFEEAGPCPEGATPFSALQDLMRSHNLYEGEPGNLASYDPDKLKILKSSGRPKPLSELLPPHVLPLFVRRASHIERSLEEFESFRTEHPGACPRQPYWDPTLRNNESTRIDFSRASTKPVSSSSGPASAPK